MGFESASVRAYYLVYIHISHIYPYACVCVCVRKGLWLMESEKEKTQHTTYDSNNIIPIYIICKYSIILYNIAYIYS